MDVDAALRLIERTVRAAPPAIAAAAALATAAGVHGGQPVLLHVDGRAPAGGDGRSWSAAMRELQHALDAARALGGAPVTIRIAGGVYLPDMGTGDRTRSFALTSGVVLMGGFAGLGAPDPDANDPRAFATVLSGDLARDDGPNWANRSDNAHHVVDASGSDGIGLIGLTISGGNADDSAPIRGGGGILVSRSGAIGRVYLTDCILRDNSAGADGGAIGGFTPAWGAATLTTCLVERNRAIAGSGGAISLGAVDLARTVVRKNRAGQRGGGVFANAAIRAESCLFADNRAAGSGGAIAGGWLTPSVSHCTFVANRAADGPALAADRILSDASWPTWISANILDGNLSEAVSGRLIVSGSTIPAGLPVRYNLTSGPLEFLIGPGGGGGGGGGGVDVTNVSGDPRFADRAGEDGDPATVEDNDYRPRPDSPCVDAVRESPSVFVLDLAGLPRRAAGGCGCRADADIGAYELPEGSCPLPPVRVHVRADVPAPGGDGLTWATAKADLASALTVPGVSEVWIKSGVYRVSPGVLPDAAATIELGCRVAVRGGFAGNEHAIDERPEVGAAGQTVITGDLLGNDAPDLGNRSDNTRTVFVVSGTGVVLDRLVIERASSQEEYGRMSSAVVVTGGALTMSDCTIRECLSRRGAGLGVRGGTHLIERCRFERNTATGLDQQGVGGHAGAIELHDCTCSIIDSRFTGNRVIGAGVGGAIASTGSVLEIRSSVFRDNRVAFTRTGFTGAYLSGGAVYAGAPDSEGRSSLGLVNCVFTDNGLTSLAAQAEVSGGAVGAVRTPVSAVGCVFARNGVTGWMGASGGALHLRDLGATLINCTIVNNTAEGWFALGRVGGLTWVGTGAPTVANGILWGNRDDVSVGTSAQLGAPPGTPGALRLSRSIVQGWTGGAGTDAAGITGADPKLTTDFRLQRQSPAIDRADSWVFPLESVPTDASGGARLFDDPHTINAGVGPVTDLDLGAYEYRGAACPADLNDSGGIDSGDLFIFLVDWFGGGGRAEFNGDGRVTLQDLFDYLAAYLGGCA